MSCDVFALFFRKIKAYGRYVLAVKYYYSRMCIDSKMCVGSEVYIGSKIYVFGTNCVRRKISV